MNWIVGQLCFHWTFLWLGLTLALLEVNFLIFNTILQDHFPWVFFNHHFSWRFNDFPFNFVPRIFNDRGSPASMSSLGGKQGPFVQIRTLTSAFDTRLLDVWAWRAIDWATVPHKCRSGSISITDQYMGTYTAPNPLLFWSVLFPLC